MTFRVLVRDLPAGYVAAGQREGDITIVIIDKAAAGRAQKAGDCDYCANLVNEVSDALDDGTGGIRLVG